MAWKGLCWNTRVKLEAVRDLTLGPVPPERFRYMKVGYFPYETPTVAIDGEVWATHSGVRAIVGRHPDIMSAALLHLSKRGMLSTKLYSYEEIPKGMRRKHPEFVYRLSDAGQEALRADALRGEVEA